ncbi:GNAT family N-acetyltransferase [Paeniglutamicibacter cryotolerans]|uniref:RimJ/RimL family protein N-acetyltransferase n=1 Tax=Paeniglutamicibacter cryotolerans TaxID=670079 RepID=A0A839QZJ0_9MICC|nr:GNAT family N-acetyltransferase [Paeniglutamicibacter cryotolerans]MBB2997391.1 RimJ/RimL family protein N-acetyltransferase [Paeniglutamicibacter cryotolerans]
MEILLQTRSIALRQFTAEDAGLLYDLDADPDVMRFITGGPATPLAQIRSEVLPAFLAYHRAGPDFGFWAAQEPIAGTFMGWFHLRAEHGTPDTEPGLGYRLRPEFWGRGLATEGSRALIGHAFSVASVPVTRVVAQTLAVHDASRRVMEKAGMVLVRRFTADWPVRLEGDEFGDVEYAITRATWLAAGSPAA